MVIAGFSGNRSFESTFGVRNPIFHPKHTHADIAKYEKGEDVKCMSYMPEQLLADMDGNNVTGTLYQQAFHMCVSVALRRPAHHNRRQHCNICIATTNTVTATVYTARLKSITTSFTTYTPTMNHHEGMSTTHQHDSITDDSKHCLPSSRALSPVQMCPLPNAHIIQL